jgi:prepilin-type N-terminal cleavage/methylation domain-containing protein
MRIKQMGQGGFTLVEIMIVVAIIGLLAAIAIPNFVKARNTAQANACINNLRQIDSAMQQWALETGAGDTTPVTDKIWEYIKNGQPSCPVGPTKYQLPASVTTLPTCPNYPGLPLHKLAGTPDAAPAP